MALGFLFETNDKVGRIMTPNGDIMEIPVDKLGGAKAGQDIDFGDGGSATEGTTPVQPTPVKKRGGKVNPSDRQNYAMKKIMSMGWSRAQAAGVVGRFMQESYARLDPNAIGDSGRSMGIGQWNGPRRKALMAFARKKGTSPRDLDTQLEFWDHEIRNDPNERRAFDALSNADNITDSSAAMMHYERPRGYTPSNPTRGHGWDNTVRNAHAVYGGFDPENISYNPGDDVGGDSDSDGDSAGMDLDKTIDAPDLPDDSGDQASADNGFDYQQPDLSAFNVDLGLDDINAANVQRIRDLISSGTQQQPEISSVFGDFYKGMV